MRATRASTSSRPCTPPARWTATIWSGSRLTSPRAASDARQTLRESEEALARIALAGMPAVPPPAVPASLQERVAADGRARGASSRAALGAVGRRHRGGRRRRRDDHRRRGRLPLRGGLGHMARETAGRAPAAADRRALLAQEMAVYQRAVELLRDPATRVVELRGAGPSPAATARMIWHDKAGGHLFVAKLPAAPPGKTYEPWTLGGPAPDGRRERSRSTPPAAPPIAGAGRRRDSEVRGHARARARRDRADRAHRARLALSSRIPSQRFADVDARVAGSRPRRRGEPGRVAGSRRRGVASPGASSARDGRGVASPRSAVTPMARLNDAGGVRAGPPSPKGGWVVGQ